MVTCPQASYLSTRTVHTCPNMFQHTPCPSHIQSFILFKLATSMHFCSQCQATIPLGVGSPKGTFHTTASHETSITLSFCPLHSLTTLCIPRVTQAGLQCAQGFDTTSAPSPAQSGGQSRQAHAEPNPLRYCPSGTRVPHWDRDHFGPFTRSTSLYGKQGTVEGQRRHEF